MRQVGCEELVLRAPSGKVLCSTIVDFQIGEEEVDAVGTYREVTVSLSSSTKLAIGDRIDVWNTTLDRKALTFTVTRSQIDHAQQLCKVEGRVYVRPG